MSSVSQHPTPTDRLSRAPRPRPAPWQSGLAVFAGIMMVIAGAFGAVQGLVALFSNEVYITAPGYVLALDLTTWGWVHLILGLLVGFAGAAVLTGQTWGRVVGITIAILSMLANFVFIPYYPVWSLLIIVLDVFVIAALCTYTRGAQDA
ncbi:DUF7144 family membrane protein [Pseudonocardia kongjuensis]|uniref:DUF7144 family membrane protein n=1 Tax=Pseudonocardia kongjuensis TaxID=102227 RepID=UPI0031E0E2AE